MKHAYLIMAHNEPEILKRLICILDHVENDIYVHIDKKSNLSDFGLSESTCIHSHLYVLKERIDVRWSGYSQIRCEMLLMETAFLAGEYDYYHIMSGVTLPIKCMSFINKFFEENNGCVFLGIDEGDIEKSIIERVKYRYFFIDHSLDAVSRKLTLRLNGLSLRLQKALHILRQPSFPLKIGTNWCSITPDCVQLLLKSKQWIARTFQDGYCVDELYKQTVIWNSPLKDRLYTVGNSLAGSLYEIDWKRGSTHSPYTYAEDADIDMLVKSDRLFARKFSAKHLAIVDKLTEAIHK